MKPLVNLASEPFRNRRLFWLIIILIFALSTVIGFHTIRTISDLEGKIQTLQPRAQAKEAEVAAVRKSGTGPSSLTPEQNRTLQAANSLIARKAFSWSQLLSDLERHTPENARVTKISVNKVTQRTRNNANEKAGKTVSLTINAVGKSVEAVTQMIDSLGKSGVFAAEPRTINPIEGTEEFEFILEVQYQPTSSQPSRAALSNQVAKGGK